MDITSTSTASIIINDEVENNTVSIERIVLYSLLGVGFSVVTVLYSRYLCAAQERQSRVVPQEVIDQMNLNDDTNKDMRWLTNVKIESPA